MYVYISHLSNAVTPFNIESNFTIKAMYSLEDVGIPLVSSLNNYTQQIKMMLGLSMSQDYATLEVLLKEWVGGTGIKSPTWKNLLQIVRQLGLNDLANRVKNYLQRTTSKHQPETGEGKTVTTEGEQCQSILTSL